eukprot:UN23401
MPKEERMKYKDQIFDNILSGMKFCCEEFDKKRDEDVKIDMEDDFEKAIKHIQDIPGDKNIGKTDVQMIQILWKDERIKSIFAFHTTEKSNGTIHAATSHFFDDIERIQGDYQPTKEDVIRVRIRTSGIITQNFSVEKKRFEVYDVGGQISERRKWIHCFENVQGVLFVVSLVGYNEAMWEDRSENRMTDALQLFEQIANSRWFRTSAIIIFLNKKDLFQDRILKIPLSVCPSFKDVPEESANDYDKS